MAKSLADVTESLLGRFDGLLPLEVISVIVRDVRRERGLAAGAPIDPETEELLMSRLEQLREARVPAPR